MENKRMQFLVKENLLTMIENSIGSTMFQKTFALLEHQVKEDITKNGRFSCAKYVSSILLLNGLIKGIHVTVEGAVHDMQKSGWYPVNHEALDSLAAGTVILWEPYLARDNQYHKHIGFFVGDNQAVSNHSLLNTPQKHHPTFDTRNGVPMRKIIAMYVHPVLLYNKPAP